jgi:hypothetical protein
MTDEELRQASILELQEITPMAGFTRSYQVNGVPGGEGHMLVSLVGSADVAIMTTLDVVDGKPPRSASLALGPRGLLELHHITRLLLIDIDNRNKGETNGRRREDDGTEASTPDPG